VPRDDKTRADAPPRKDPVTLIDDDGTTLWVSPTDGPPIDLRYLPPGVMLVLTMRPEAIAAHREADKIWEAGGPLATRGLEFLSSDLRSIPGVRRNVIGLSVDSSANWSVTQVVSMSQHNKTAAEYFASEFPDAAPMEHDAQEFWLVGERAYYLPESDERLIVVTTPAAVIEIIDLAGQPPPLRRDLERLLTHTDAERHITILFTPSSLFREGRSMFNGPMAPLRAPLDWFLGEELSAAALSFHWDENFYCEFVAMPTLDTSPERAARILADRVRQIPGKIENRIVGLNPQPYGRAVVARFPAMVRTLTAYTRSGYDPNVAILNGYLPAVAGHNLLMGAELTLAEWTSPGSLVATTGSPPAAIPSAQSINEKLTQPTTLRFSRDTLEAALAQLAQDIGVPITIRGADLQADGITKNQSFGIDLANKPAEEVLIEILRLANPDKTAVGSNDVKQKLVYVIGPGEGGTEQIFVTTRTAAAARSEELPAAFQSKNPQ
jgi:hypothetical protein